MCAADAVLYHCGKDTLEDASTGNIKGNSKWRWVCAAAMSLVFPCLCCYLPLKGCQKVTEAAYAKATSNGCRCEETCGGSDREGGSGGRRRRNNVITTIPTSPMTTLSSTSSSSALSSPVRGGGGGIAAAVKAKTGDSFEQRLLL